MLILRDQASSRQSTVTLKKLHRVNHENQLGHNLKNFHKQWGEIFPQVRVNYFPEEKRQKRSEKDYAQDKTIER